MSEAAPVSAPKAPPPPEFGVFGQAFRDPEAFMLRWHKEGSPYSFGVFLGLALIAVVGTLAYGALLGVPSSPGEAYNLDKIIDASWKNCVSASIAWVTPLPALYILGSMSGMRLRASTTFLASLLTAAWGGFALLAFLPVILIYLVSFPGNKVVFLWGHMLIFALVGFSMATVFGRVLDKLEPNRGSGGRVWWLLLFVLLKIQLLYSFGLISFEV